MFLYNLTLQTGGGINRAVCGNFSAPKAHEIVVARNKTLELLRPDQHGKTQVVFTTEVFGIIRSLAAFRLTGATKDYVAVGSDSGRIVILAFDPETQQFRKVHQETFGKSGVRRAVPGQHLVVDPKGRAVMIGAVEKQKLVYVLNRDAATNLTISSPLEANKSQCITFALTALDRGLENPGFAAIELEYGDADLDSTGEAAANAQKQLTFYELDLGLNHVARRKSEPIDNGSNMLIAVPGGSDGPGGVLIGCENFVLYKNENDAGELRVVIPRRKSLSGDRGVLLVNATSHKTKKDGFFFLVQSEYGDIYKIVLENGSGKCPGPSDQVANVKITYFDTVPTCVDLCVLRSGFLFAASEFGDHILYQFTSVGDDDSSDTIGQSSSQTLVETDEGYQPVFFDPQTPLRNLTPVDTLASLCPVLDAQCHELLGEETPQLYALCGAGSRSSLKILKRGVSLTEMAVSPLPGNPNAIFTVRKNAADAFDDYIVVSFVDATLVLKIGDTVEEVTDSGFVGDMPTLSASRIGDRDLLQVHPGGLRHARADGRVNEWRCPGRKTVTKCATNERQCVVSLSGGELVYFELDTTGALMEIEKVETSGDVACLSLPHTQKGQLRSKFCAVGSYDSTVRILSLSSEDCLQTVGVQALASAPNSLLLLHTKNGLYLNAGLNNGVLIRADVDDVTGTISEVRSRFLGTRPPLLYPTTMRGENAMVALSSRPWLGFTDLQNRFTLQPVSSEPLDHCASFASDQCPEGIVACCGNTLRVVVVDSLNESFNAQTTKLRYTPREMSVNPDKRLIAICESDNACVSYDKRDGPEGVAGERRTKDPNSMEDDADDDDDDDEFALTPAEQFGAPKASPGQWASCLRLVDPRDGATKQIIELENNEAALCLTHAYFPAADELFLVVGSVVGLTFAPRDCNGGFISLYRYLDDGHIELFHKTPVDGVPGAVCAFNGKTEAGDCCPYIVQYIAMYATDTFFFCNKLIAGVGNALRLYEFGKKKLLRKAECADFPNFVTTIHGSGDRVYVGDVQESFHYIKYKKEDSTLYVAADDTTPRHVTSAVPLDYDTMCGGDKFGNVFVTRLTKDASVEMEEDPTGGLNLDARSVLNGSAHKTTCVAQFHVGETVCALTKGTLTSGGNESVIYCSLNGTIGALSPFVNKEDVDFCTHLEMHLRQEKPPLLGRDHLAFRGAFFPVKNVIDGDLCEQFGLLNHDAQKRVAEDMDLSPSEILKKLEDLRAAVM